MKNNKQGVSLILAIGLVLVSSLLAYTILSYMVPFAKNIKGIENATVAYYHASSGIEKGLYALSTRADKHIMKEVNGGTIDYTTKGSTYQTSSSGTILPNPGDGNSEYDNNWNRIGIGEPIQISVGYGFISSLTDLKIKFRVPRIDQKKNSLGIYTGENYGMQNTGSGYISWQLTGGTGSLSSSSFSLITGLKINNTYQDAKTVDISSLDGKLLNGTDKIFSTVFSDSTFNCDDSNQKCILKFSIVSDLKAKKIGPGALNVVTVPYLEWKIISSSSDSLPLRYTTINTEGVSYGFGKKLSVKVPQETVNQAFDFAVFQ